MNTPSNASSRQWSSLKMYNFHRYLFIYLGKRAFKHRVGVVSRRKVSSKHIHACIFIRRNAYFEWNRCVSHGTINDLLPSQSVDFLYCISSIRVFAGHIYRLYCYYPSCSSAPQHTVYSTCRLLMNDSWALSGWGLLAQAWEPTTDVHRAELVLADKNHRGCHDPHCNLHADRQSLPEHTIQSRIFLRSHSSSLILPIDCRLPCSTVVCLLLLLSSFNIIYLSLLHITFIIFTIHERINIHILFWW